MTPLPVARTSRLIPWFTLALGACGLASAAPAEDAEVRIARVLSGLHPPVGFVGDPGWTLSERMRHHGVPGLAITAIDRHGIAWTRVFGTADRERGTPVRPDTLFQAASISKPVSAFGALTLVRDGRLALHEPVNAKLKTWRIPENDFTREMPVTLHGFGGYAPGAPVPEVLAVLDGTPPANSAAVRVDQRPGQAFRYSGGGYTVAQLLMSEAAGQPFEQLMQQRVLKPLGMADSHFQQPLPAALAARAAAGVLPDRRAVPGGHHVYPELAAAGLWTTSQDLARFALGVQQALAGKSRLMTAAQARDMLTGRAGGDYGLGLGLLKEGGEPFFAHSGWNEGFSSMLIAGERSGQGVVILSNGNQPALLDELRRAVALEYGWPGAALRERAPMPADALAQAPGRYRANAEQVVQVVRDGGRLFIQPLGEPRSELVPVPGGGFLQREHALARSFEPDASGRWALRVAQPRGGTQLLARLPDGERAPRELLLAGDLDAAQTAYAALRDAGDAAGHEAYLNAQAYALALHGHAAGALAFARLNTALYPESANAWDSLGELAQRQGDTAQARAAYRRAVALKPELKSAEEALRRLGD
jgi:CubicO group peptidase (beta-lactamase class C family)